MAKILFIEDNNVLLEMYQNKLQSIGYEVITALDGEDGWEKIKLQKPDLIILDVILPKLDGTQVLKMIRENEATKNIPVLVLTNIYSDREVSIFEEAKVAGYLIKSDVSVDEVLEKVKEILTPKPAS